MAPFSAPTGELSHPGGNREKSSRKRSAAYPGANAEATSAIRQKRCMIGPDCYHNKMRTALVLLIAAAFARSQDWDRQVRALRPADVKAQEAAVLDELQQRARAALDAISHARTREEADRARPALRQKLRASLGYGLLPAPDLRPRTVGTLSRPGFRIEKLVYQTFPGTRVRGPVYVPEGLAGPAPAILFYSGHWWPD